jgi:dTDP-4-amino-4,6-dideoxygalactose transaminase
VHTYKDFSVIFPAALREKRPRIMESLKEKGVETRAYFYPPVHEQDFFRRFSTRSLPRTEDLSRRVLTLPFFTTMTYEEMDYLVDCLARSISEHS